MNCFDANTLALATSKTCHANGEPDVKLTRFNSQQRMKTTWIARKLDLSNPQLFVEQGGSAPIAGDCVLAHVTNVGNHSRIFTRDNEYSRLYEDDLIIGVAGARYATDAFHAKAIDPNAMHVLTNAGLLGTVCDRHSALKTPTQLEVVGCLVDDGGSRVNIKQRFFRPANEFPDSVSPILTVGTGMNSGKTTTTARLGQSLANQGLAIAILKLTGSASHRDIHEFSATGAVFTADFSDYGFSSTYLSTAEEIEGLYCRMMCDAAAHSPDVVLVEIADGVFQRETQFLLNSSVVQSTAAGVVLTAACAPSALSIVHAVRESGWEPILVSGLITNAPLFVEEFSERCDVPICSTGKGIQQACSLIKLSIEAKKNQSEVVTVCF